ncbi:arginine decarboxylase [Myroides odoratimimus]|uniref:arginine decarboxylase n=1 Tax=Myroides odoratimimus TaxID=76832 RepID=UPI0025779F25|nr:arginine decarboxylase [Myroides odoratimimus]MDM1098107.1 arginine decarboxylase [Myroides odoratimimus]MDM1328276.1 arginine decarboxylase [Myroides odoratimimus]MDM1445009.1 arginine decarboxylase [Myroides odoratimimus]MDM1451279.1 arginine decarboxylase [Myroides odoratimimus]MDM1454425.1 arginine decarboxylase [Myroides odoratimimus]
MNTKYVDLINQTFYFPQEEFKLNKDNLQFHNIDLMGLVEKYGTPLKFTYLPKISENISNVKTIFRKAMEKNKYKANYYYCYCTKSSHFSYVLNEAFKNDIHVETSSAFDVNIVENLLETGKINKDTFVLCNGFKRAQYIDNIANLINNKHENTIPIIDNYEELDLLQEQINKKFKIGIRIASEESPKFEFYTSRLGIGYKSILPFYRKQIAENPKVELKMLHFFINTGIRDTAYYWNELVKCLKVYITLKKECPTLDSLNIGGGFPIKDSLAFEFDYQYMVDEIINQIKIVCDEAEVPVPNIFTEFGSYTVGESGGAIYEILYQKQQNDREKWNMIDSSFITTLPDSWAINKRFIMLPINRWNDTYERILLGGLTCDSDDYYNSEQNLNAIYLPKYNKEKPLYIGFFNTGAYQDQIGGFGGIHHCLIPQPKHILIDKDENGIIATELFSEQQTAEQVLDILGYNK